MVGNGQSIHFLEDAWLGDVPLSSQYPMLYNIVRRKNVLLADVLSNSPLHIEFRRNLVGNKWDAWLHLVQRLMFINLPNDDDKFVWKLNFIQNLLLLNPCMKIFFEWSYC